MGTLPGAHGANQLRFHLRIDDPTFDRTYLTYESSAGERFFGFGEQFTHFDLKGRRVPIFVMEQGVGRGRQPTTFLVDLVADSGGDWHTSYAPVPHYLTTHNRSLFLENTEFSVFDLRHDDRVQVEVFSGEMTGRIVHGASPLALIREYTEYAGRMRELPEWAHRGIIVGMQGGTARVRDALSRLEARGAPLAAFWLQDWVGQRTTDFGEQLWWNWELDRERYPDWEELVTDLHARGVRVMLYVNPFLVDVEGQTSHRRNLYREAQQAGFLVRNEAGAPYEIPNTSFSAAIVDLANPAARDWLANVIRNEMIDIGASGWMADFGEALPYDVELFGGESPTAWHNHYPEAWAELNRRVIEEAGVGDDAVFFTRSGFTRSPRWSTLFWLGDQLVTWDRHDGLKSAVTGILSGGISGISLNHSDIGGYTTIDLPVVGQRRSKELMQRWSELTAFGVVFRTHEGNVPDINHQFDSDEETLEHFVRMARVHAAWFDYRRALIREAAETGAPVLRHLYLHYPDDPEVRKLTYQQFLVGSELLVAPVLDPGREEVEVYLPAGRWVHLFTGKVHGDAKQGRYVKVAAPIGTPAAFHREGSAVGEALRRRLQGLDRGNR